MKFEIFFKEFTESTDIIRALLVGISQEESRIKPKPDSWSILELLCHLYDEEREDFRPHLSFILDHDPDEWQNIDPQNWVTMRRYNQQGFVEMQGKFFEERMKSMKWLKDHQQENWDPYYSSKFGTMSAGDLFASWIAHDNLAIRQFVELRRSRIENITKPYSIDYAGEW